MDWQPSPLEMAVAAGALKRDQGISAATRRRFGVVHTPPAVARALVEGLHWRLSAAGSSLGLLDPDLTVVDPACGPGAFVAALLAFAQEQGRAPGRVMAWDMDAECLEAVDKVLGPAARACGCGLAVDTRDCLQMPPGAAGLSGGQGPVVVMGNPPWAVAARSHGPAMGALLEDFRRDGAGVRLQERKLGVLRDAYVCFFRVAAALCQAHGAGSALGLLTNHSFLDGPVHRGMRHALLRWFGQVDVVDLGGNALVARIGRRDDNLFGVRPGVAVTWAVQPHVAGLNGMQSDSPVVAVEGGHGLSPTQCGQLRSARLWGTIEGKTSGLWSLAGRAEPGQAPDQSPAGLTDEAWVALHPEAPGYLWVPRVGGGCRAYREGVSLVDAMPFHREGVQTNRDLAVVAKSHAELLSRLRAFADGKTPVGPGEELWGRALAHYDPAVARARVTECLAGDPLGKLGRSVRPIAYRPFDTRYFAPISPVCHRPRPALLAALTAHPLALLTVRKDRGTAPYRHAALVRHVADSSYLSARSSCRTRVFPAAQPDGSENLAPQARDCLAQAAGRSVNVVDFIDYAAAVLHAPRYLAEFDEALRADYPRIPLPDRPETFAALVGLGRALRQAYLAVTAPESDPLPKEAAAAGLPSSAMPLRVGHMVVTDRVGASGVRQVLAQVGDFELPRAWFH